MVHHYILIYNRLRQLQ